MSASREKNLRRSSGAETKVQNTEKKSGKAALYWVIGILAALLIAALILWNNGVFTSGQTAAVVANEKYSVTDLNYLYYQEYNAAYEQASLYSQYGISTGYDASLAPDKQFYDEDAGITYKDHFKQSALETLQWATALCDAAQKDGFTLSDDAKASIDASLEQGKASAAQANYTYPGYLRAVYGNGMTPARLKDCLTRLMTAYEYETYKQDQFTYADSELETYYEENRDDLDCYEFQYCYLPLDLEYYDADGNEITHTDAELSAAKADVKASADEMAAFVKNGTAFNTAAQAYVSDEEKDAWNDANYNHYGDILGENIASYPFSDWLTDSGRKVGDVGAVESENGCYVVRLLNRDRAEDAYNTVDVRHILVYAELDEGAEVPTQDQLDAAKAKAESILNEWKTGAATEDSFAALAETYSEDTGSSADGGLITDIARGATISTFNDWIFTRGRKAGDTGIVANTDGSGNVLGYHVIYFSAPGEVYWKGVAAAALSSDDYNAWYDSFVEAYPITEEKGMAYVGA